MTTMTTMLKLAALWTALCAAGCATLSGVVAASGHSPSPLDSKESETVPRPGYSEHVEVRLHAYGVDNQQMLSAKPGPEVPRVSCEVTQVGQSTVYTRGYRYGSIWKYATGIAFLVEAGLSAALIATGDRSTDTAGGILLGADALATGALFFIPRREVLEQSTREQETALHTYCPSGLVLESGGQSAPVGSHGVIPQASLRLLGQAIAAGNPVTARIGPHFTELEITEAHRCAWERSISEKPSTCTATAQPASGRLLVLEADDPQVARPRHAARSAGYGG